MTHFSHKGTRNLSKISCYYQQFCYLYSGADFPDSEITHITQSITNITTAKNFLAADIPA
jgi:hypothetical protein